MEGTLALFHEPLTCFCKRKLISLSETFLKLFDFRLNLFACMYLPHPALLIMSAIWLHTSFFLEPPMSVFLLWNLEIVQVVWVILTFLSITVPCDLLIILDVVDHADFTMALLCTCEHLLSCFIWIW